MATSGKVRPGSIGDFIDAILDFEFSLRSSRTCTAQFLRHENHADIFTISSLLSSVRAEVKVYDLRGLSSKQYRGRVNNIKRLKRSSKYLYCKRDGRVLFFNFTREKAAMSECYISECGLAPQLDSELETTKQTKTPQQKERARIKQQQLRRRRREATRELIGAPEM
jgi:hypothetical protein